MLRRSFLLLLLLAGCSEGPEADLPAIGEARSLAAEWALVNQQASDNKLIAPYVKTMRAEVRKQLQTAASSLTQRQSGYGREIESLLAEPDDAAPDALRAHADKLKQIEDHLESA
jgi:hypothetical protein